jgi:trans-aconitate methyltransferase
LRTSGRLKPGRRIIVVDAGSGFGDMARKLDAWAQRQEIAMEITGVDRSPWSTRAAVEATPAGRPIRFVTSDVFDYETKPGPDVVISSLFAHHLDDRILVQFVRWMEAQARVGWFINDLHRHWLPFHGFRLLSRVMRLHEFVQHDGPISIARAFTRPDWERIIARAGLVRSDVQIAWRFPFRLCVGRIKHE